MSFQETLNAFIGCDIKTVQSILAKKEFDINCKDILTKNIHDIQNLFFFHKIQIFNHFWNSIEIINWTPLIYASCIGYTKIVQLLLSRPNIDINCKSIYKKVCE